MSATLKKLPKSEVELTIVVPYADYLKAEAEALQEVSKEMKVDGFRSGHIPEEIVREKAGPSVLRSYTIEILLPSSYAAAVKEHNLEVVAQPKIEVQDSGTKEGGDFVYKATVAVMPEVKVGNYKKIKVKKKAAKVTDKELEETLEMILSRFAEWQDVQRPAKKGDRVEIDFEGFDEKGVVIPGTASKNHPIILGSKTMIPGFEEAIDGMNIGQEKEFKIDFPSDYHAKEMQGKRVDFKAKLNRVEEKIQQVLDEAVIEKITGTKQSLSEFKERVTQDLEHEMKQRIQTEVDSKVVQEIIKITSAELPDVLIEQEIAMLKDERKQAVTRQGLTWEQYLQHIKKTDEDFAKDYKKPAEERLLARFGVNQIIKEEKIEASESDVEKRIEEIAAAYPEDQKKKVFEYYQKGSEPYRQLKNGLSADMLINMFVEAE